MNEIETQGEIVPKNVCLPPATIRAMRALMGQYLPDKDIADRLGVKIESVRFYRRYGNPERR